MSLVANCGKWVDMLTRRGFLILAASSAVSVVTTTTLSACGSAVGTSTNDGNVVFSSGEELFNLAQAPALSGADTSFSEVTLTEQGWWAKDGYVHWGVTLANGNASAIARDTTLTISLFDENDDLICEDEAVVAFIGPNREVGFAGTSGDGLVPARVDVSVGPTSWWQDASAYREPVTVESVDEQDKLYFRYEMTGQVKNWTTEDIVRAPLSIILRNESGEIAAGYTGAAYRIKPERAKDYLVTLHSAPEHTSFDIYAQPCEGELSRSSPQAEKPSEEA